MENLKIYIHRRYECNVVEVWLIEETIKGDYSLQFEKGKVIKSKLDQGAVNGGATPFLSLPVAVYVPLFKAIAEFNSNAGIKVKDENLIEGKLKATEIHLHDMREMARKLLDSMLNPPKL